MGQMSGNRDVSFWETMLAIFVAAVAGMLLAAGLVSLLRDVAQLME